MKTKDAPMVLGLGGVRCLEADAANDGDRGEEGTIHLEAESSTGEAVDGKGAAIHLMIVAQQCRLCARKQRGKSSPAGQHLLGLWNGPVAVRKRWKDVCVVSVTSGSAADCLDEDHDAHCLLPIWLVDVNRQWEAMP